MVSDWLNEEPKKVYVIGISNEMAVIRVSHEEPFKLHEIINNLKDILLISGGGHERAGTIKFLPASKDEVVERILEYIHQIE